MKVITVKAKLKNKVDFLRTLADIDLQFGETYYQHDRIFLPRGFKPDRNLPKAIIRTNIHRADKAPSYYLLFKRHLAGSGVNIVHRTEVRDYTETAYILHQLGFEMKSEITKQRQNLTMDGGVDICIDKVENVGTFVKIESVLEDADSPKLVREDLIRTLEALDIKSSAIVDNTYANLARKK